jgi:hypothetical protein
MSSKKQTQSLHGNRGASLIAILQRIIARLELGQLSLRRENKTMHHIGGQVASILWPRKNVKRNPTTEETNE